MQSNIAKTNQIFLITILVSLCASFLPISRWFPDYAGKILFSEVVLAAPGAVYLLHAVSDTNTAVLGSLIDDARQQGYTFAAFGNDNRY